MSKRHKKMKMFAAETDGETQYDFQTLEAPKGKRPRGKAKRATHKAAYWD